MSINIFTVSSKLRKLDKEIRNITKLLRVFLCQHYVAFYSRSKRERAYVSTSLYIFAFRYFSALVRYIRRERARSIACVLINIISWSREKSKGRQNPVGVGTSRHFVSCIFGRFLCSRTIISTFFSREAKLYFFDQIDRSTHVRRGCISFK